MHSILKDKDYQELVGDILDSINFRRIDLIDHHGTTRFTHCLRVSYYSYKIAKKLHLDYKSVARGGLLHDYFDSADDRTKTERFLSTFTHPKHALRNAVTEFELNNLEQNIIRSHMFPVNFALPKYTESWLVSCVDKGVGFYEFICSFKARFRRH